VVFKRLGSCTKRTIVYISLRMWLIFFSFSFFYYLPIFASVFDTGFFSLGFISFLSCLDGG
jgi:hypothetical protein